MVYKHNIMPCDQEDSFQVAFQHMRQLDCGDQFASSGHRQIPEKQHFPDGARPNSKLEVGIMDAIASNHISGCGIDHTANFSLLLSSNADTTRSENNVKRAFGDDESFQATAKRARQMDGNFPAAISTCEGPFAAPDDAFNSRKDDAIHGSANDCYGRSFSFRWFACSTSEDNPLDSPARLASYPGYYEDRWWPAGHSRGEVCQSPVFDSVPRKPVAIGPDHQADIPIWRSNSFHSPHEGDGADASASCGHISTDEDNCNKWTRHCVMPMPDSSSLEEPLILFKRECHCLDVGSIRCVRQHVMEARDELMRSLGHKQFVELGFHDMGEVVALEWTKGDERLFDDVVVYNPASMGKNFWDALHLAFPSRSSKELVSYYFNVFMLRKRAYQNRCDSSNVDSDNDEWQYSDNGEFEDEDEEDDSGVESPADADAEDDRVHGDGEVDIHEEADEDYRGADEYGIPDGFPGDSNSKFGPGVQPIGINSHECTGEDQDVHDDSCTSFEGHHNGVNKSGGGAGVLEGLRDGHGEEADHGELHPDYRNAGMSGMTGDHELILGHCDLKPWEMGYFHGLDKDLDLLPTSNVIEEVFGNETWEKSREDHGAS